MKNRARILILNFITQFSLSKEFGDGRSFGGLKSFNASYEQKAVPGDLVALQAAPATKWYLSWLVSRQWPEGHACEQYTLESIEDGELCDWSNVGLMYYDREEVELHPEWRWTDEQHEFNDRWLRSCRKERDAYMHVPLMAQFSGDGVTLGLRTRWSLYGYKPSKTWDNWKKVTIKQMLQFYDDAVANAPTAKSNALPSVEAAQ